ncbi:MAG: peptidoglycan recognition family protein [Planctomycetales bacterium]
MFSAYRTLCWIGTGIFSTGWMLGCVQSMPLPPAPNSHVTSRPAAVTPTAPSLSNLPPTLSIPASGVNPWKPNAPEREWKYIVLHHTAAEKGSVDSIHQAHLARKDSKGKSWLGIGYHFVIGNGNGMPDGEIEPTFRWVQQLQGAHAGASDPEYNQKGIGVVLVGNFEKTPPTSKQMIAVKKLVKNLANTYHVPSKNIIGHRDIRSTECPGKYFPFSEVVAAQGDEPTFVGASPNDEAAPVLRTANQADQKEAAFQ